MTRNKCDLEFLDAIFGYFCMSEVFRQLPRGQLAQETYWKFPSQEGDREPKSLILLGGRKATEKCHTPRPVQQVYWRSSHHPEEEPQSR